MNQLAVVVIAPQLMKSMKAASKHLILPLTLPMIISRSKKMISNLGASYHYWRGPFLKLAVSDLLLAPFVGGPDPHELANREGGLISCFHGFRGHEPNNFNRDRARHLPSSEAKHSGMNLTLAHLLVRPLKRTSFPDSNRPFSDADNSLIQNPEPSPSLPDCWNHIMELL